MHYCFASCLIILTESVLFISALLIVCGKSKRKIKKAGPKTLTDRQLKNNQQQSPKAKSSPMKKQKQTQAAAVPEKSSDKLGASPKKAETETAINSIDDVHPSNEAPKPRKFALDEKAKKIKDQGIKTLNPNETIGHVFSKRED
ncbi:unnamed protein product [Meloidogyne enterolobii]|uniref:Uncharacterized protein n=2 Tax=Meloidogyne enterolobii TaxID=390850 RepID=A0A6V7UZ07_MELEN|nr:unnamed protein product [Meloidogyne enterolobii]